MNSRTTFSLAIVLIAFWASILSTTTVAQTLTPLPQPSYQLMTNGTVYAMAAASNGSVVFGGHFTTVNGAARANIARLQPDGTLDTKWNPGCDGFVYAIGIGPDGSVYVGGSFNNIGGAARSQLAKLAGTGSGAADPQWNVSQGLIVDALAVDNSGDVYVGGRSIGLIQKISGSGVGTIDPNWRPATSGTTVLAVDNAGSVFANSIFAESSLLKISAADGTIDTSWAPNPSGVATALAVGSTGDLFVGGVLDFIGGQQRRTVAKISVSTGMADPAWNPEPNDLVTAIVSDGHGNIYLGGMFTGVGGQPISNIARVSEGGTGVLDQSWNPGEIFGGTRPQQTIHAIGISGTTLFAGGEFTKMGGQTRLGMAALSTNGGAPLPATDVGAPGTVYALATQANGGTLVGGDFFLAGAFKPRRHILRLQPDGTLDPTWALDVDDIVQAIAIDSWGTTYLSGRFYSIGGVAFAGIGRLIGPAQDMVDTGWSPNTGNLLNQPTGVTSIAFSQDNSLFAFGSFQLKKISLTDGSEDPNWSPQVGSTNALAIAVDAANSVYIGGNFTQVNGNRILYVAKLSGAGTGAPELDWDPGLDAPVTSLVLDNMGNIYLGGTFINVGGQPHPVIARASTSGTGIPDATWAPLGSSIPLPNNQDFNEGITAMLLGTDGYVYAGGNANNFNGNGIIRGSLAKWSMMGVGAADPFWNSELNGPINAFSISTAESILVGGAFSTINDAPRDALVAVPLRDEIFAGGFE